jgi:hypothetical protein
MRVNSDGYLSFPFLIRMNVDMSAYCVIRCHNLGAYFHIQLKYQYFYTSVIFFCRPFVVSLNTEGLFLIPKYLYLIRIRIPELRIWRQEGN